MPKTTTDKIMDLIAREAERAYRRGFQQGKVIGPRVDDFKLLRWRYGKVPVPGMFAKWADLWEKSL